MTGDIWIPPSAKEASGGQGIPHDLLVAIARQKNAQRELERLQAEKPPSLTGAQKERRKRRRRAREARRRNR